MSFAMAPQVTAFLAGTRPDIKKSEISCRRGHDRGVEIHHGPIRACAPADYAVRVVARRAPVAHVGAMRPKVVEAG